MTNHLQSKHRGAHAELIAATWLLEQGYDVFRNISPHGIADLIACKDGEMLRIDVKSGRTPKLTPEQEDEGVILLRVEDGNCEFESERNKRLAEEVRALLAEIDDDNPTGRSKMKAGVVTQMRQRLSYLEARSK